ncbi:hypothetical protein [Paractinoplanes toevensis]|uniref:Uncharacterized protein n=1 Tax=Paractinoplanes toevensis TaxID=571911 RepID=A0A919W3L7_9ACTN|nr:hypothetical protein [Actinoplanes toevensis]GIM90665.1 hypothetical protein Ato02nite_024580 [Actinoplanes toevensis]
MRSGISTGEDGAPEATRRVVRLFVLLGVAVAVYLGLSLFDHAARADAGSIGQPTMQTGASDPITAIKAKTADATKAIAKPKPITPKPKSNISKPLTSRATVSKAPAAKATPSREIVSKASSQRTDLPAIEVPDVRPPEAHAPKKTPAPKVQATRMQSIRDGERAQRVQVRTPKPRRPVSGTGAQAARTTVAAARTPITRPKLSSPADRLSRPEPTDRRMTGLPALPQPSSSRQLPSPPQAHLPSRPLLPGQSQTQLPLRLQIQLPSLLVQLPALPQVQLPLPSRAQLPPLLWVQLPPWSQAQLPSWPQVGVPSWSQLPGLAQVQPRSSPQLPVLSPAPASVLTRTAASLGTSLPYPSLLSLVGPQFPALASGSGLSGVATSPAAQAQKPTAPSPAPARQPGNRSTPAGQAHDSGGGNTPATGMVSSSWRPDVAAVGGRLPADVVARGRTVRYAGPPS